MKTIHRLVVIAGFAVYFVVSYFLIAHYVAERGVFYTPILPGEGEIPFIPWTFFIYILCYVVPPLAFLLLQSKTGIIKALWAFIIALWIHKIVWILYPVKYVLRPNLTDHPSETLLAIIVEFFKLDSPPVNCLPSLHVTYVFLTYFAILAYRPRLAPCFLVLAFVISLSTMTFKQHYVADVLSGLFLSMILSLLFFREGEKNSKQGLTR